MSIMTDLGPHIYGYMKMGIEVRHAVWKDNASKNLSHGENWVGNKIS